MLRSLALTLLLFVCTAFAQTPDSAIPMSLKDWRPWVLKDLEYHACPFLASGQASAPTDFVCAWPGRLKLAADANGANFSIHWRVEAPTWISLPGDEQHWPQQVTVNAQHQPVLIHDNEPALWLQPGSYEIAGVIPWSERPQSLAVPQNVGLIALSVDGKPVVPIQRDGGQITLGRVAAAAPEADSLQLRVFRKLDDGVPAQLSTRIALLAAGQAREEVLGPVLPVGFAPTALNSAWPSRVDGDGRLHVQVQPGSDTIMLEARATAPLTAATARVPDAPWPAQEIWSYEASPRLRVTAASGSVQVDPRQAEVPAEWQALPAFALKDGDKLAIEERSRGLAPDEGNRLTLQREAWLDFSGAGWFARDVVSGRMAQGWRFDVAAPFTLEQATARNSQHGDGGNGEALLITRGAKPELSGVEWRTPNVNLAAGVRIGAAAAMPVAGWQEKFDQVQATLHFPYGYKLLGAPGADSASGSWVSGWTLLDVFLCAIVVLLAWRLLGLAGAATVVAYLVLGYQESGSPLWSLLIVLALALIARALPEGKLARFAEWLRRAALLVLVLIALSFLADQVRFALYPQLEEFTSYAQSGFGNYSGVYRHRLARDAGVGGEVSKDAEMAPAEAPVQQVEETERAAALPPPAPPAAVAPPMNVPEPAPRAHAKAELKAGLDKSQSLQSTVVTGSNIRRVDIETKNPVAKIDRSALVDHYSQTTVVQTGGGTPNWNLGSTAWLSWGGPVLAEQSVHLLIAPPWLVRGLRLVLAALLAWLIVQLFRTPTAARPPRGAVLGVGALLFGGLMLSASVHAQTYPNSELLQQLRARLVEAPKCAPRCAGLAEARIDANGDGLGVALELHSGERVALPLPSVDAATSLKGIKVDGVAEEAVWRSADGTPLIALGRGVHRIELDYAASADKATISFALKPARVLFSGRGWEASGLTDDHLLTETLTLARAHDNASSAPSTGVQQFPPYVRVERHFVLGLEWSTRTRVARLSPAQGGFTVEVPLISGEHVTSPGIKVHDGKVPAAIADGSDSTDWDSALDKDKTEITLNAPALGDRAEVWYVQVSPTWHVDFSGVPGVGLDQNEDANDYREFEFHPLPGEALTLKITRPLAAQGAQRAIDMASLRSEAGQRATTHDLYLTLRASQGGEQVITLPKVAEVISTTRDNQTLNLRAIDGKLTLPVVPGTHRYAVRFRDNDEISTFVRTPAVALGLPAANVGLSMQLPADRWLLAAFGPPVGPAVLYWGELIVMIAVAYALARTGRTRLRFRDWLLLGLGFSTFSWYALLLVVAWLFAFDWRGRAEMSAVRWRFNLLQVALALLAAVAVIALASAIPQGLLGSPDMHVTGNGSYAQSLQWFADRTTDALPQASALSLPMWVYKVLMLAWALWLANALIGWLREAFAAWTQNGYWRAKPVAAAPAPAEVKPDAPSA